MPRSATLALVVLLVVGCFTAGLRWLQSRRALRMAHPQVEGSVALPNLRERVQVVRDRNGVPHVWAGNEPDAWFALGFLHGQDRLAQMLWLRRLSQGRTAEVVGREGLAADRWARTLGLARLAEADWTRCSERARAVLRAYVAGVNARLERVRSEATGAPLALRHRPDALAPWTPEDSLALLKLHAWSLGGTVEESRVLSALIERFGALGARSFFPEGVGLRALGTEAEETLASGRGRAYRHRPEPLRWRAGLAGSSVGSTAFVVNAPAGTRAGVLLAADSHFPAQMPAHFYESHLVGGGVDVAGATLPGIPAFWTGFTPDAVWASTHYPALVSDLVVETLHPEDPDLYRDRGRWRPLAARDEVIEVRGAPAAMLRIRETRHGPLVHELLGDGDRPLALRWSGAAGGGLEGLLGLATARSTDEIRSALQGHHEPVLNVVFADRAGRGGSQLSGYIPRREVPSGAVPVPGRGRAYAWRHPVSFDDLPNREIGARQRWVIAADAALEDDLADAGIEVLWRSGERARRIEARLESALAAGRVDLTELVEIQRDVASSGAREVIGLALQLAGDPTSLRQEAREVAELLSGWDGFASASSVGAAAYHVFLSALARALFESAFGPTLLERYLGLRGVSTQRLVAGALAATRDGEEGGLAPGPPASVRAAVRRSLRDTWLTLSVDLGPNREKWNWGRLHPLRFVPLVPEAWRRRSAELGPFPYGGDGSSIRIAEYRGVSSFLPRVVSTYRFAADASDLDQALTALAPGQSEHPGHRHSVDGLGRWLEDRPTLLSTSPPVIEDGEVARLMLEPTP